MNWYKLHKLAQANLQQEIPLNVFLERYRLPLVPDKYEVVQYRDGGWAVVDIESKSEIIREERDPRSVTSIAGIHRAFMTICFIEGIEGCSDVKPLHRSGY